MHLSKCNPGEGGIWPRSVWPCGNHIIVWHHPYTNVYYVIVWNIVCRSTWYSIFKVFLVPKLLHINTRCLHYHPGYDVANILLVSFISKQLSEWDVPLWNDKYSRWMKWMIRRWVVCPKDLCYLPAIIWSRP